MLSNTFLFEVSLTLTFLADYDILVSVPERNTSLQGNTETLAQGDRPCIGNPKGEIMKPMKKPIRLLGMVFQID